LAFDFDHTELLCDRFYELVDPLGKDPKGRVRVRPGQLIRAQFYYPPTEPYIMEVLGCDPRDETRSQYVIKRLNPGESVTRHVPIKELGLRSDENYSILLAKKRPAVVLQTIESRWLNKLYAEPYVVATPCFTFKPRHDAEYQCNVMAMQYPNLFPVPGKPPGLSKPAVLRFELTQPLPLAATEPFIRKEKGKNKHVVLSDRAWALLLHQFFKFTSGKSLDAELEDTIDAYGELVLDEFKKSTM